jgi:hypothetical protein
VAGEKNNPRSVLTDDIFSCELADGSAVRLTLPGLLEAVDAGTLKDLSAMRPHQRGPVVTTLAILRAVLRLHMASPGPTLLAEEYASAWRSQVGEDAARVSAPYREVAFLQYPLLADPHLPKSLDGVDVMFSDVGHEVKGSGTEADAETWIYAMMSGMLRIYVKDNVSGSRWGNTMILAGDGKTIGSEILHLSEAYLMVADDADLTGEIYPTKGSSAADHLVFLQPVEPDSEALSTRTLPYPFLESARAVRLVETEQPGVYRAIQMTLKKPRVDVKVINENIIDPHVAISKGKPYRLIKARGFDYRFAANILFAPEGGDVEQTVHAMGLNRPIHAVRICALRTDTGKTTGYYERIIPVRNDKVRYGLRTKAVRDRLSMLANLGLRLTAEIQAKAVFRCAAMMQSSEGHLAAAAAGMATDVFRSAMDEALPLWVMDRAAEQDPDGKADLASYAAVAVPEAFKALEYADRAATTSGYRRKASAWGYFIYVLSKGKTFVGYDLMKEYKENRKNEPGLVDQVGRSMAFLAGRIEADPNVTKTLRTMSLSAKPIVYWRLAQELPLVLTRDGDAGCWAAADVILRGLGSIAHKAKIQGKSGAPDKFMPGFGTILASSSFPESRIDRLISASGETLLGLADEAVRFAVAKGSKVADWRSLAGLLIADAVEDLDAVEWYRRKLATEFVRFIPEAKKSA